ncbi:uncharacterized protein LOC133830713 isoform X2 [Humulus lupulus]|nr:uncharacterized protein LOC133830713 isoform X2 [Humulus lupulus]XP_062116744.1 uncharacterized protein LOC133830713 isoform X2 [Humulus lupulus]
MPPKMTSQRKMIVREDSYEDIETTTTHISSTKRKRSLKKKTFDTEQLTPLISFYYTLAKTPTQTSSTPMLDSSAANTRGSHKRVLGKTHKIPIEDNRGSLMATRKSPRLQSLGAQDLGSSSKSIADNCAVDQEVVDHVEERTKKRTRGPTKMKSIATDSGGRLEVKFNSKGQPIGTTSVKLSSFLGAPVREIVPITITNWRKITPGMKEVLWKSIQARYKVDKEWQKYYVFRTMADLWRASKSRLVSKLRKAPNEEARMNLKPDNINSEIEWKSYVREIEFKAKSEKFRKIRTKQLPHICSRKGYARLTEELVNNSGSKEAPSRVDVWTKAHKKKNGQPVNLEVAEAFDLVEEYKKDLTISSTTSVNDDILTKVLGPEKNTYLRAFGRGVTRSKLAIFYE